MFRTQSMLNDLHRHHARAGPLHRSLAHAHGLIDALLAHTLPAGAVRTRLQIAIGCPRVTFRSRLTDGIVLRHHLEDYFVLDEVVRRDLYRLRELPPASVVVDVGAQVGVVSVLCARRFAAARVIAFEPSGRNHALAAANLAANGCSTVELHRAAAASRAGEMALYLGRTATHSVLPQARKGERVTAVTLDGVLVDVPEIDLLKIDVEGAELDVLAGAVATLARARRAAIETHAEVGTDPADVRRALVAAGFEVEEVGVITHARRPAVAGWR